MRQRRHAVVCAQVALAAADVAFFVALAALCDADGKTLRLAPVYTVTAIVFAARCRHYYVFADTLRNYRRAHVDLPLPVGEARPILVAALYSVLTSVVEMVVETPLATPVHCLYVVLWALVVVGNLVHGLANDDRAALRRFVQSAFARRRRHARRQAVVLRIEREANTDDDGGGADTWHSTLEDYKVLRTSDDDDDDSVSTDEPLFDTQSQHQRYAPVLANTRRAVFGNADQAVRQ